MEYLQINTLQKELHGNNLIVVANREPYIHHKSNGKIEIMRPASGVVAALEPILRNCGGLWIAHGSGNADMETSGPNSEILVPPTAPKYVLHRVWLNHEEELGYYYGFANEGIWPLCHMAHTRPVFRLSDWHHYCAVNKRFSDAIMSHATQQNSLVLVQDYHFAILPRLLKSNRLQPKNFPGIGLFWHIPWPNPEAFEICPWHKELLRGMLGADVIGFHTQYHCNNFLETCNRYLEARVDLGTFSVTMENHETRVRAFPIGIDTAPVRTMTDSERRELKLKYGITSDIVAVGVDRLDYTKGLIERIEAVERFLEKYPQYIGRFTLAQMGSPSRGHIPSYQNLVTKLHQAIDRVNAKFVSQNNSGYKPIIFMEKHHDWDEIQYFYQIGDICLVTSLHDGMNLVAKEYVWCQKPERGALILSKFTGASRELSDAFIVNPYSIEEMADAIATALALPATDRERRMLALRKKVQNHTAYHWASDLIATLLHESPQRRKTTGR
ncbi:MAG: trehalose-6-phosphate synthase [Bdellovibrionota bacterium]